MRILTAAQMREADRLTSERHGVTSLQLMGNAGSGVVAFLQKEYPDLAKRRILILCGKGNNGGDGFVVARLLFQLGSKPGVFLFARPEEVQGDAAFNLERWRHVGGALTTITEIGEWKDWMDNVLGAHELVVDALLGTGLSKPVEGLLAYVIQSINEHSIYARHKSRVLAVDMPSGLPSDDAPAMWPVMRADWTVTFTAPKIGQLLSPACENVGRLIVHSIGTPRSLVEQLPGGGPDLRWLEPGEFRALPLRRRADTNKGTYGHALIVAGSRGKAGAAALAGWGALRTGAGLVTVATPEDGLPVAASYLPELMTAPLAQTTAGTISLRNFKSGAFKQLVKGKNVLAIGPGLTTQKETQKFVLQALAECPLPIVLDADGLNALAAAKKPLLKRRSQALVLTPHPGEMARLLGVTTQEIQADRLGSATRAAKKYRAFIVLKGFHTIVATPDGCAFINSTGNPGMATAGTGDVLTGMLAGLTAQFGIQNWERILGLGVYLHGLAGDIASARVGEAPLIASDLIGAIPEAFMKLRAELEDGF
ncbi:MAG TPA: NAD(P)H-hydrate dehydratase [Candidatus Acidoferrales bacterium]|nr:NAD(P)H-hydrate dehydratase [Candidatus Acidoferrales bacterium]